MIEISLNYIHIQDIFSIMKGIYVCTGAKWNNGPISSTSIGPSIKMSIFAMIQGLLHNCDIYFAYRTARRSDDGHC